jgi:aryl-alcohol dehydrogenase-like predicted oxidoreductase
MRLGLGGAPLGNLFEAVTQEQACALLEAAWADGCRSFDTAPHYGHGLSERRMGQSLGQRARAQLSLSSKVGRLLLPQADAARAQHGYVEIPPFVQRWDLSAAGMRRSVEDSLQRLGMARLDAVFVHDIDAQTHGADAPGVLRQVLEHSLPALRQLQALARQRGADGGLAALAAPLTTAIARNNSAALASLSFTPAGGLTAGVAGGEGEARALAAALEAAGLSARAGITRAGSDGSVTDVVVQQK